MMGQDEGESGFGMDADLMMLLIKVALVSSFNRVGEDVTVPEIRRELINTLTDSANNLNRRALDGAGALIKHLLVIGLEIIDNKSLKDIQSTYMSTTLKELAGRELDMEDVFSTLIAFSAVEKKGTSLEGWIDALRNMIMEHFNLVRNITIKFRDMAMAVETALNTEELLPEDRETIEFAVERLMAMVGDIENEDTAGKIRSVADDVAGQSPVLIFYIVATVIVVMVNAGELGPQYGDILVKIMADMEYTSDRIHKVLQEERSTAGDVIRTLLKHISGTLGRQDITPHMIAIQGGQPTEADDVRILGDEIFKTGVLEVPELSEFYRSDQAVKN